MNLRKRKKEIRALVGRGQQLSALNDIENVFVR